MFVLAEQTDAQANLSLLVFIHPEDKSCYGMAHFHSDTH